MAAWTLTYDKIQRDSVFGSFFPIELVKCKYYNRKPMQDFIFDGISDASPLCYSLRDIWSRNMHDLDLNL